MLGDNLLHPFHEAWTACVGEIGYNKEPWSSCLHRLEIAIHIDLGRGEASKVAGVTQFDEPMDGFNAAETFTKETLGPEFNSTDWDNTRSQLRRVLAIGV